MRRDILRLLTDLYLKGLFDEYKHVFALLNTIIKIERNKDEKVFY